MKRKWVKGVVAAGVIGCLLAGCASAKPAHLNGLDKLGAIEVVTREEGSGTRSTFAEKQELSMLQQEWIRQRRTASQLQATKMSYRRWKKIRMRSDIYLRQLQDKVIRYMR